ncbi:putative kinase [Rathayibacter sp. PhB152]|uniref:AAA family ATPase n=1 Tax=Rathayibacter sp. PhB152 TaxID=2485190 RepID=UPI000F4CD8EB|nr:AAA family ATPase [Rathayibacter sp. PhB152]ROQ60381.1 putative kinase [Rathayibacter sp. PhB152]
MFALVVVGSAGSGKSTVAREIARQCRAVYLDKDALASPLVEVALSTGGHGADEREGNSFYRDEVMPAEYAGLFAVAADNLRLGLSVVIDAPFAAYLGSPDYLGLQTRAARWPEVSPTVLRVAAGEDETRRRLERRGLDRDLAKLADWPAFWSTWGRSPVLWTGVELIDIDNSGEPDLDAVLEQLASRDR